MMRLLLLTLTLAVALIAGGADAGEKKDGYIKVEAKGVLKTGIAAIGGETTGTILMTPSGVLELDFGKNADLRKAAEKLNDKTALVSGTLSIRRGVEIRQRVILAVSQLKAGD